MAICEPFAHCNIRNLFIAVPACWNRWIGNSRTCQCPQYRYDEFGLSNTFVYWPFAQRQTGFLILWSWWSQAHHSMIYRGALTSVGHRYVSHHAWGWALVSMQYSQRWTLSSSQWSIFSFQRLQGVHWKVKLHLLSWFLFITCSRYGRYICVGVQRGRFPCPSFSTERYSSSRITRGQQNTRHWWNRPERRDTMMDVTDVL